MLAVTAFFALGAILAVHALLQFQLALAAHLGRGGRSSSVMLHELPFVTVQLPIYNERLVVEQLLESVADLDYPRDRLEIQVLDDSTDETSAIAAAKVAELRARGLDVTHLRRARRDGYKAGALEAGLEVAHGEFVAMFDADFLPAPDFLLRALPSFEDPLVAVVQGRWGHTNRLFSLLTRLQALMLDVHFCVEQLGRNTLECFFNFNGSGGIWRVTAIRSAGGWTADTLAEDLSLSYRAQLRGWRFVYRDDLVVPSELPTDLRSLRSQQFRWMKGQAQNARALLPLVVHARLGLRVKVHACAHLLQGALYPVILAETALAVAVAAFVANDRVGTWALFSPALLAFVLLAPIYYLPFRRIQGRGPHTFVVQYVPFLVLATGLTVHNCVAVISGFLSRGGEFARTPKRGLRQTVAGRGAYIAGGAAGIAYVELAIWGALAAGLVWAATSGFLYLLWLHFLMLSGLTLVIACTFAENVQRDVPREHTVLSEAEAQAEC